MNLVDIGEFGFIDRISAGCLIRPDNVIRSIGDDAAAFRVLPDRIVLLTTDLLVERVHFLRNATSGFNLGYKALAVNLSDIAAMGGIAREAFVSLAVPKNCDMEFLIDLYNGMKHLNREFDVNILGGDTTASKQDLIVNISVVGCATEDEIRYRNTALVGDIIYSTGYLGDSRAGLHAILNRISGDTEEMEALFQAHVLPRPCLREGRFFAMQKNVHAAIDVSDGLSSDLGHIVRESGVGARLFAKSIPISQNLRSFCERFAFNPVEYALAGGEDYALIVTIAREHSETIAELYQHEFGRPLFPLGEIIETGRMEMILENGEIMDITPTGWDHFRKDEE